MKNALKVKTPKIDTTYVDLELNQLVQQRHCQTTKQQYQKQQWQQDVN